MKQEDLDNSEKNSQETPDQKQMSDELKKMAENLENTPKDNPEDTITGSDSSELEEPITPEKVEEFDYEKEKQEIESRHNKRFKELRLIQDELSFKLGYDIRDSERRKGYANDTFLLIQKKFKEIEDDMNWDLEGLEGRRIKAEKELRKKEKPIEKRIEDI